ncbi:MAG: ROK family protein, partial [Brachybacterium tyrofermentans]
EANMAALLVGERVGAGLIVDGRLLHGALGGAGEMRFLETVLQDDIGAEGVGSLARRWTLESLAAGRESPLLAALPAESLTAVDVFAAAQAGDALARDVLDRIGERIARIAAILVSLLGIERIVLAGAVASSLEPVLVRAREVLPDIAYAPFPELVASGLGRDAVVRGAIEHALTRLREDPLELLEPLKPPDSP